MNDIQWKHRAGLDRYECKFGNVTIVVARNYSGAWGWEAYSDYASLHVGEVYRKKRHAMEDAEAFIRNGVFVCL